MGNFKGHGLCVRVPNQLPPHFISFLPQEPNQQTCDPESQCCQNHGPIKRKVGIVAAVVLLLAVTQTTLLLVQTYVLPRSCETQINSSDYAAEKATKSDDSSVYFQVIELLRIAFSFMTFPDYTLLVHGLYKLLIKTSNCMHKSLNHPSLVTGANLKMLFQYLCKNKLKPYRAWIGILLVAVFTIIFALLFLTTPIMDIAHAFIVNKCYPDCKEQQLILIFTVI